MVKDEAERTEDRICFAQAELRKDHPLQMLYRFHSAAVSKSPEFAKRYQSQGESEQDALRAYAVDLEKALED